MKHALGEKAAAGEVGAKTEKLSHHERRMAMHPGKRFSEEWKVYRTEFTRELHAAKGEIRKGACLEKHRLETKALAEGALEIYHYLIGCYSPKSFKPEAVSHILTRVADKYCIKSGSFQHLLEAATAELTSANHAIREVLAKYPARELFKACFESEPVGKVQVLTSPIHIHFRCFSDADYAQAYAFSFAENDSFAHKAAAEEAVSSSTAAALEWSKIPELWGKMVIERVGLNQVAGVSGAPRVKDLKFAKSNFLHELLHKLSTLIPGYLEGPSRHSGARELIRTAIIRGSKYLDEHREKLIWEMVRERRIEMGYDKLAADEVISFYAEGYTPERIYQELTQEGGHHDFFIDDFFAERVKKIYKWANYKWQEVMQLVGGRGKVIPREEIDGAIKHVFRDDYYARVRSWVNLIKRLEGEECSKDRREKIATELFVTPYTKWSQLEN